MIDRPFQDRAELVEFVGRQAPTPAIRRACVEGEVEVLGAFSPPGWHIGFLLRVVSRFKREWLVHVWANEALHRWQLRLIDDPIPWTFWQNSCKRDYSIYAGDHPAEYRRLKDESAAAVRPF
jgi:hypothetical protein